MALAVEALCRRYPAYTPETAAAAPAWLLRHMALLALAGVDQRTGTDRDDGGADAGMAVVPVPPRPRTQAEIERMLFG